MHKISLLIRSAFVLVMILAGGSGVAQEERLSVDWLFSDEGKMSLAMPRHTWLESGQLVLYDMRKPEAERGLMSVDLRTGRRKALTNRKRALAAMNEVFQADEALEEPGWPAAFSANGKWALYEREDDVYLLNLDRAEIVIVAATPAEEGAARFSPDSEWLAFVRDNDIYIFNIEDGSEKRLTHDGSETLLNGNVSWVYWEELLHRSNRGYLWAPDSSAIAFLQSDESMVGIMKYVDFKPGLPDVKRQRHPKAGAANPRVRAGVVGIKNAKTTWADLGTYPHEYLANMQWLPDSQRLAVQTLNRSQTVLDVFLVDAGSGEATHLLRERDDAWVDVHDDLWFLADGERFLWRSERDGHAHLYLFDMQGELIRQVTSGEWALKESGGSAHTDRAVAYVSNNIVWFTALEKDSTERHLYRINLDGSDRQRLTQADGTHAVYFHPAGDAYLDHYSALSTPPAMTLHRADGEKMRTLVEADASVKDRFELQPWELFSVKARDGFEMPAMLLKPRYFDPEKQYPAVVYVYAGPSAPTVQNAWQRRARGMFHQMLADEGVVVFQVDNRSAAGKSKRDAKTILRQLYGPVELQDLLDGVAWLKSQPWIDGDRVGVWGWSGGGTMTLSAMTGSEEFAAGIAVAAVTDWHYYDTIYTERYMKRPQDNEAGYESTSLVKKADQLSGNLFLVHGTYDDNVHPQNAWAFSDALIDAGILFDMMIYPMRKHGISDDEAQAHLYRSMQAFWARELDLEN
ncbi:MAG: DPP IV N-terminal domain-containing protein [Woeseia sp.]|nr:DPP IV N-terminal domain-containing protein [Woeseia sp.]